MNPRAYRLTATLIAGLAFGGTSQAAEPVNYTGWSVSIPTRTPDGQPEQIAATILKPGGDGPFAAIAILHDCSGLGPRSSGAPRRWATLLVGQAYVVIIPDSFAPRGFPDGICNAPAETPIERLRAVGPLQRSFDAYGALAYLRTQSFVDGAHVGVMGGSHGGSSTLGAMARPAAPTGPLAQEKQMGFAAGVALYPGCADRFGEWSVKRQFVDRGAVFEYSGVYRPIAPLLILIGAEDDWTPAEPCEALAERARAAGLPVAIKVYPGARHSFDSSNPVRFVPSRRNANAPEGRGATTGGNPQAWADSIEQVTAFFAKTLNRSR